MAHLPADTTHADDDETDIDAFLKAVCPTGQKLMGQDCVTVGVGAGSAKVEPADDVTEDDDDLSAVHEMFDQFTKRGAHKTILPPIGDRAAAIEAVMAYFPNAKHEYVARYVDRGSREWLERVLACSGRIHTAIGMYFEHYEITNEMFTERTKMKDFGVRAPKAWGFRFTSRRVIDPRGRSVDLFEMAPEQFNSRVKGRRQLPVLEERALFERHAYRCNWCRMAFSKDGLSPDHRLPHHLFGEADYGARGLDALQALCVTHNNEKNSACRRCRNFKLDAAADASVCMTCQWASPENFTHVAMQPVASKSGGGA
jgi:hypothetical protein